MYIHVHSLSVALRSFSVFNSALISSSRLRALYTLQSLSRLAISNNTALHRHNTQHCTKLTLMPAVRRLLAFPGQNDWVPNASEGRRLGGRPLYDNRVDNKFIDIVIYAPCLAFISCSWELHTHTRTHTHAHTLLASATAVSATFALILPTLTSVSCTWRHWLTSASNNKQKLIDVSLRLMQTFTFCRNADGTLCTVNCEISIADRIKTLSFTITLPCTLRQHGQPDRDTGR